QSPQGIHHYIFGLCSHSNSPIRYRRFIHTVRDFRFSAVSRIGLFGQFQIPIIKRFGKMNQRLTNSSVFPFLLRSFRSWRLPLNLNTYRFFPG
ncbi:MAG: hypothetical protein WBM78_28070, partial [Desulfobacterales bacterium]